MNNSVYKNKETFQQFVTSRNWSHFITIEPQPGMPMNNDEMNQRMRQIEFNLNKTCLKSSFPKWDMYKRFYMMWFAEGGIGTGHKKHFHLLLHSPDQPNQIELEERFSRYSKKQTKLTKIKTDVRTVEEFLQHQWCHLPRMNYLRRRLPVSPLDIGRVRSKVAVGIYGTKTYFSYMPQNIYKEIKREFEDIRSWGLIKI